MTICTICNQILSKLRSADFSSSFILAIQKHSPLCTVCSSLWVKIVNSDSHVFELYKEDGSNWFMVNLDTFNRDFDKLSDIIRIYYRHPRREGVEIESFTDTVIPIVPHSW